MDVADIGAGSGLISRLLAQRVAPGGTVYAVDVARNMVDSEPFETMPSKSMRGATAITPGTSGNRIQLWRKPSDSQPDVPAQVAACALVGSVVAIGDRRPYNTALIVLDPVAAAAFAAAHGIGASAPAELAEDPLVIAEVQAGVETANGALSRVEQIKRHRILHEEWQPGGDELTPTMKLRRRPISEKYAAEIEAMYS
jgi:hypothetical protein